MDTTTTTNNVQKFSATMDVVVEKIDNLTKELDRLSKKCVTLGFTPLTIDISNEYHNEIVDVTTAYGDGDFETVAKCVEKVKVTISGEIPVIDGWQVALKVTRDESSVWPRIVQYIKDIDIDLTPYSKQNNETFMCEHCNTNRKRKGIVS